MTPTREELLDVARKHYSSAHASQLTAQTTPETQRLHGLWAQWAADMGSWYALRDRLSRELPGHPLGETYPTNDGGPRCLVYPPKARLPPPTDWVVVGCVSLLAPVYFVYGVQYEYVDGRLQEPQVRFDSPPPDMAFPAQAMAMAIESVFGYSALSREMAEMPVALFAGWMEPPQTTLFHVLFTNDPDNIP